MGGKSSTYEIIKNFVEIESQSGCKLLSKEYVSNTILYFECKCENEFSTTFNNFKNNNKRQCNDCGKESEKNKRKQPYIEVKKYVENLGYELIDNEYINNYTPITLKDEYGYFYYIKFKGLKLGNIPHKFNTSNPYTIQNIKLWCKLNNKPLELLSEIYKGNKKKLLWKCLKDDCKETFDAIFVNMVSTGECGCPYCAGVRVGLSNCLAIKRPELILEWHPTKNGDLTPYDVTCGSHKDIWWICEKGHEWSSKIKNRKTTDCPYCSGFYPSEDYNLEVCNPELILEWDYSKNNKKPKEYCPGTQQYAWWKCQKCNHEWEAIINTRTRKTRPSGCPQCAESKGEKEINNVLTRYNNPYDSEHTFADLIGLGGGLLRFDVPVFWDYKKTQLRLLIEYDGIQHFEWVKGMMTEKQFEILQIHDNLKDEYCKKNDIKLFRIPYWDFDNIEQILKKELNL